jgi:hypothetical protein
MVEVANLSERSGHIFRFRGRHCPPSCSSFGGPRRRHLPRSHHLCSLVSTSSVLSHCQHQYTLHSNRSDFLKERCDTTGSCNLDRIPVKQGHARCPRTHCATLMRCNNRDVVPLYLVWPCLKPHRRCLSKLRVYPRCRNIGVPDVHSLERDRERD